MKSVQHKLFPDLSANNHRVEFIPVEWRSGLKLDGGTGRISSVYNGKIRGRLQVISTQLNILIIMIII